MAAANTNPCRIQQRRQVVGMDALHGEGRQGAAIGLLLGRRPEHLDAIDGPKPIKQQTGELLLVGMDAVEAQALEVIEGCAHANGLTNGGGPSLKLMGQLGPTAVVEVDVLDHFAAT